MSNLEFVCESHHQDPEFVEDSRSCSNRRAAGRENFECFSSRGIVSTVKRKRIYEPEPEKIAAGGKRLNVDKFSFMNWVASITNGLSRPLDGPSEALNFRSNFQSIESSSEIKCIDHQKEMDALKGIEGEKANSCAKLMVQNSSWVTRLSRCVHSPQLKPLQCSNFLDLHGSVRAVTEEISSKHCERSSSFTWRLDALKHAKPSKICLFCGMSDHCIRECSEVVEAKLDKYLKSISVLGNIKKASCPYSSSKGNQISLKANGLSEVNLNSTAKKIHENQSLINYDGAIMLGPEGKKDQHQVLHGRRRSTVSQKDDKDIETDPVVCEEVISHKNVTTKSELKPFCSRLPTIVIDEPKGFFIYVRKLRLSRRDVLRWMKSRASLYNLGGFFLRLRIGKLDKGFGGTSYHVACINGASCPSSISVCVGSSTYSANTSFISNHDFNENELKAWWFQNLRDGTKMASSEELNDKFQLRLKFGF